jgi:lincosamide nucleotidyltransferase
MLPQKAMIERVRALCQQDERVDAAMMYGSFTHGEGDPFSDIEFVLFFEDGAFAALNRLAWLEQIASVALLYSNDFGIDAVIFENLVRGEFHFHRRSEMALAGAWHGALTFPSLESALVTDKSGLLTPYLLPLIGPELPRDGVETCQVLVDDFVNQYLFGLNVLRRGDLPRALEMLSVLQRIVLRMARVIAGKTRAWFIPSRRLEEELGAEVMARLKSCTAALDAPSLERAYSEIGAWAAEMARALSARCAIDPRAELHARITEERLHTGRAHA